MPQLYFRYLRTRDPDGVPRMLRHNRWDLVALAALTARAEALLAGPDARHDAREWLGAARWLERREPARSVRFYEAALGSILRLPDRLQAAWRLGRLMRRAGQFGEALALWAQVVTGYEAEAPLGLLIDLAKLHEHVARDPAAALALTRVALARAEDEVPEETRDLVLEALRHRRSRLERRMVPLATGRRGRR
jgi:hypothetical protein